MTPAPDPNRRTRRRVPARLDARAAPALVAFCVLLRAPAGAAAQDRPADGAYEDFSPLLMAPVGAPLASAPALLPRWVEVATVADVTRVTFLPDARVVWEITWGPGGAVEKRTLVDGDLFTRSVFERDGSGRLVRKIVTGPGSGGGLTYAYTTDADGRVLTRTATLPRATGAAWAGTETETVTVDWTAGGATVRTLRDAALVREDRIDAGGRLLSTTIHTRDGSREAALDYGRRGDGTLERVTRRLPGRRAHPADFATPDATVEDGDVFLVFSAPLERHEALLFLGAPVRTTDAGRGVHRAIDDDWSSECWMNAPSGGRFDAAGLSLSTTTSCICGFCVDAMLETSADGAVLATDLHWTRGPWVRLDDRIDVTVDHALVTPSGPVLAGELHAGDVVLDATGEPHTLSSVVRLPDDGVLRLGRNLRTEDGTFAAGGFLFVSEAPRTCTPPP